MADFKLYSSLMILFFFIASFSFASTPINASVHIDKLEVKNGIIGDKELIIYGALPNLCHKHPKVSYLVNDNVIDVSVTSKVYEPDSIFCPMSISPFMTSVKFENLPDGNYDVVVNRNTMREMRTSIYLAKSNQQTDSEDKIVALVKNVTVSQDGESIVIEAYNPSNCYEPLEAQVVQNSENEITVYPLLEKVSTFCPRKMVPVQFEVNNLQQRSGHPVSVKIKSMGDRVFNISL